MYDRDEEQIALPAQDQPFANPSELAQELKNSVFLLSGLYHQMQEERSVITSATGQMTHAAKQFEGHIKQLGELEKNLKIALSQYLQKITEHAVNQVSTTVGETVARAATQQSEVVITRLSQATDEAARKLQEVQRFLSMPRFWGSLVAVSIGSGIACVLGMHFLFR